MLLKELKLLEIDDTPFERALAQAGSALVSGGNSGRTSPKAKPIKDVSVNLRPLVLLIASRVKADDSIFQSEVRKITSTSEMSNVAHDALEEIKSIIENIILVNFSNGIKDLPRIKDIAKANGHDVTAWFEFLSDEATKNPNRLIAKNQKFVVEEFEKEKDRITDSLMKLHLAEKISEHPIDWIKKKTTAKPSEELDKEIESLIEGYYAYFAAVLQNIEVVSRLLDEKSKAQTKKS